MGRRRKQKKRYQHRLPREKARHNRKGGGTPVRCLGPGPEHTFASPDPVRVRVCEACRRAVHDANPSLRETHQPSLNLDPR